MTDWIMVRLKREQAEALVNNVGRHPDLIHFDQADHMDDALDRIQESLDRHPEVRDED